MTVFEERTYRFSSPLEATDWKRVTPDPERLPAKLHRITQNDVWTLWKVELVVPKSGLRPNQYPRLWFAVKGVNIAFLCIGSHIDNYRDGDMDRLALSRLGDIF